MSLKVEDSLQSRISALKVEHQKTVISSFLDLMSTMVDTFVKYAVRSPSSKATMTVHDAQMKLFEVERSERDRLPFDKNLRNMVHEASESFLSKGPLTKPFQSIESDEKNCLEFPPLPAHYKEARTDWKKSAETSWKSYIVNTIVHSFAQVLQGNRVEPIEPYSKEERTLLGEAADFVRADELTSGYFALLKSKDKSLGGLLKESPFLESNPQKDPPDIDKRGFFDILKSLNYKEQMAPVENDLIVDRSSDQVYRYLGNGLVQCKYGNDAKFTVEEGFADLRTRCDHLSVMRK